MAQAVKQKSAVDGKTSHEIMMIMAVTICATRKEEEITQRGKNQEKKLSHH